MKAFILIRSNENVMSHSSGFTTWQVTRDSFIAYTLCFYELGANKLVLRLSNFTYSCNSPIQYIEIYTYRF